MRKMFVFAGAGALLLPVSTALAQTNVTLQASEEPEQKPWTQPAQISFSSAKGAKDSWALDAALRGEFSLNDQTDDAVVARAVAQISTAEKSKVQTFQGEVGYSFNYGTDTSTDAPDLNAFYLYGDIKLGAKDKVIFADPKAVCTAVPLPAACGRQHETSLTGMVVLQPFMSSWENTFFLNTDGEPDGPALLHSFAPVLTFFYDNVLSAKVNASGITPDGSVAGMKLELNTTFSPKFTDYRLLMKASGGWTYAAHRGALRAENFPRSTTMFKLSADYELGQRSFEYVESDAWVPAIGVSYNIGDDPLSGRLDQENFTIAFKLTFRAGKK